MKNVEFHAFCFLLLTAMLILKKSLFFATMDLFIQIPLLVHIGLLACVYMTVGIFMADSAIAIHVWQAILTKIYQKTDARNKHVISIAIGYKERHKTSLMELPPEIRDMIYEQLLVIWHQPQGGNGVWWRFSYPEPDISQMVRAGTNRN
jgi:hypothetical protein